MAPARVSQGLTCVVEEAPRQDNMAVAAAAEQRRQHILASMAKLEGNSKATSGLLLPPSPNVNRPPNFTKTHHKTTPISQQFMPIPCRQTFTGFAATPQAVPCFYSTPQAVPCFYYYPVYPTNLLPMPSHFVERNSMPSHFVERNSMSHHPSLTVGSTNLKHISAPIHHQATRRGQDSRTRNVQQEGVSSAHSRHSKQSEILKTPQKTRQSHSIAVSPESSPEPFLCTPPPIIKHHSNHIQSNQLKQYPKLQFSEVRQHPQHQGPQDLKRNVTPINPIRPVDQRSNSSHESRNKIDKKKYKNLISSNNYALQLESKQSGAKLIEKKRLTMDEVKLLEALPPLPPRPDPRRSSLLSPPKKEKKDPFAWFRY